MTERPINRLFGRGLALAVLLTVSGPLLALIEREASWLSLNYQNYLSKDETWMYLLHNELRFTDKPYLLQTVLTEDSVGYSLNDSQRLWVGYYWAYNNFSPQFFQENRFWQQFNWKMVHTHAKRVASRTRIEEINYSDRHQNLYVLRQMFVYEPEKLYFNHANPLIYDEVFLHLNNPRYATTSTFSQNRLFLGVNLYFTKHSFWKIGYTNQYETSTHDRANAMTHTVSISYTFGAPEISLPIDS